VPGKAGMKRSAIGVRAVAAEWILLILELMRTAKFLLVGFFGYSFDRMSAGDH
jgi:hypothetical protein